MSKRLDPTMVKVLFVCYGNACRSQMAEGLANQLGNGKVQAFSAGTHPMGAISYDTRVVMGEKGVSLQGHWSKGLEDVPISEMDVVVEMGAGVNCGLPADFKGRVVKWQIPDPFTLDRELFRDVRDLIESEIRRLFADLDIPAAKSENGSSEVEGGSSARES